MALHRLNSKYADPIKTTIQLLRVSNALQNSGVYLHVEKLRTMLENLPELVDQLIKWGQIDLARGICNLYFLDLDPVLQGEARSYILTAPDALDEDSFNKLLASITRCCSASPTLSYIGIASVALSRPNYKELALEVLSFSLSSTSASSPHLLLQLSPTPLMKTGAELGTESDWADQILSIQTSRKWSDWKSPPKSLLFLWPQSL